jgi:CubicO group peptidase (beta-lactamase class C family)
MQRRDILSLLAGGAVACAAPQATAADPPFPQARAYLRQLIDDGQFNGAVLLIHRDGAPVFAHVDGWLDGDHHTKMTVNAICQMASMTKPITGVSTLILVERGKLRLDDPVDRWLPELANRRVLRRPDGPLDDTVPSPRPITVRDLLSFRCGYGGDGPRGPFGQALHTASTDRLNEIDGDAFLKALGPIPLQYAPGQTWLYDVPADILAVLIARVSGQSFGAFVTAHVLDPLGMVDTAFYVPPSKLGRLATLPAGVPARPPITAPPRFESGAHGIYSTGPDYLRFTRMLLNGGNLGKTRILQPQTVRGMSVDTLTPQEHVAGSFITRYPGRGYGQTVAVRTDPLPVGPSVGAFNWAGATGVWFMIDPPRKMTIVAMVQHPGGGPPGAAFGQAAPAGSKHYIEQRAWNDALQSSIYQALVT